MTGLANIRGRHVRDTLTAGIGAIVATDTISGNATMIHRRYRPCRRNMTDITGLVGGNMGGPLARGNNTVMTALAGTNHLTMIHTTGRDRYPRRRACRMTFIAGRTA